MRNLMLKIALLGDAAVGKTSLRRRFMGESFSTQHLMTIGADFSTTKMAIDESNITFQLWDIAGAQGFSSIRSQFYRGVKGALCVFDVTRQETYLNIPNWINELWQHNGTGQVPIILLGNKSDLRTNSSVPKESAEVYAKQIEEAMTLPYRISYLDTSAKTGLNVNHAFEALGRQMLRAVDM